jgi:probable addiction module antidote protein
MFADPEEQSMPLETTRWDIQDHLDSHEAIVAYLEAAFEDGDPELIAAALGDVARARGLDASTLPADARLPALLGALRDMGVGLALKAA